MQSETGQLRWFDVACNGFIPVSNCFISAEHGRRGFCQLTAKEDAWESTVTKRQSHSFVSALQRIQTTLIKTPFLILA